MYKSENQGKIEKCRCDNTEKLNEYYNKKKGIRFRTSKFLVIYDQERQSRSNRRLLEGQEKLWVYLDVLN